MEVSIEIISQPVRHYRLEGRLIKAAQLDEIMDALEDTDGIFTSLIMDNHSLSKFLEELGVIKTNARGAAYKGERYTELREILEKQIDTQTN